MTPSQQQYRTAIVGTGGIATAHAQATAELGGRATIVAAVDIDRARAAGFASTWQIPASYGDIAEMLAVEKPDLVHICTPPGQHVELAIACLRAGARPLIEKPPALSLAELDALAAVERECGIQAIAVFQHRFGSGAVRLRELDASGVLGRPLLASCNTLWYRDDEYFAVAWRGNWEIEGGGPTMGHGIHQFDLLLSILGEWEDVTAIAGRQSRPTETEDVSVALVRFTSGAIATVTNSLVSVRETSELRFDYENATVELEHLYGYGDANWRVTARAGDTAVLKGWRREAPEVASGHLAQLTTIIDALDAGQQPEVSLTHARDTMEFVAAVYASAFTGRRIARGELTPGHPFYERMQGTGAPWLTTTGARS